MAPFRLNLLIQEIEIPRQNPPGELEGSDDEGTGDEGEGFIAQSDIPNPIGLEVGLLQQPGTVAYCSIASLIATNTK